MMVHIQRLWKGERTGHIAVWRLLGMGRIQCRFATLTFGTFLSSVSKKWKCYCEVFCNMKYIETVRERVRRSFCSLQSLRTHHTSMKILLYLYLPPPYACDKKINIVANEIDVVLWHVGLPKIISNNRTSSGALKAIWNGKKIVGAVARIVLCHCAQTARLLL